MAKRDYYKVLGVSKNATEAELKKAYRRLAMKHHPDRNPDSKNAEDNFKEAKEAHDILSDAQKRAAYDQFGHAGVENSAGGGAGGAGTPGGGGSGAGQVAALMELAAIAANSTQERLGQAVHVPDGEPRADALDELPIGAEEVADA